MSARGWILAGLLLGGAFMVLYAALQPAHVATPEDKRIVRELVEAYARCRDRGYYRSVCMGED